MYDFDPNSLQAWKHKLLNESFSSSEYINLKDYSYITHLRNFDPEKQETIIADLKNHAHFMLDSTETRKEKEFWAKIIYITSRQYGSGWYDFLQYTHKSHSPSEAEHFIALPEDVKDSNIPYKIIQCRPDKHFFDKNSLKKTTWYQKNPLFSYKCLDDEHALKYLSQNFGDTFVNIYNSITYPAGKADFMALAFLYWEGGIFADVFSACRASISRFISHNSGLTLFANENRVEKFFIAAKPRHPLIKRFLNRAVKLIEEKKQDFSHENFTDHQALTLNILDAYCENESIYKDSLVNFIPYNVFSCFVDFNGQDEFLSDPNHSQILNTIPSTSILEKESLTGLLPSADRVLGKVDASIIPPSIPLTIIGHDHHQDWSERQNKHVITPAAHVYEWSNISLSGPGGLWKDDTFIQLDSYLSHVCEMETRDGHWKQPTQTNITHIINDPVIVAFGAGYGCYGHYIVDEIPRLGLIKHILGDNEFHKLKIVMPLKTPKWAFPLLKETLGIEESNIKFFDHENDKWLIKKAITSEYLHRDYTFNPFTKDFYRNAFNNDVRPFRKICLSRKSWEVKKSHQRIFKQQDWFENEAVKRGFELVSPERLSIRDQIRLMAETKVQIGEHGSAQHASIYSKTGMTIGTINPLGNVQINIGRVSQDKNIIIYENQTYTDEYNNTFYSCDQNDLLSFFDSLPE
nr:glycosyltransferase 61 family protein [uncultured Neokomagataea sp.]